MIKINKKYIKIKNNYLFSIISNKKNNYLKNNPNNKIYNLGIGDVTLPFSKQLINVIQDAIVEQGDVSSFKGYPPELGYDFLKSAICKHLSKRNIQVESDEVFVSNGACCDIGNILDLFSGATALVCNPTYPAYFDSNFLCGNKVEFMEAKKSNNFLPMPNQVQSQSLIYLCSPNNPTGATYSYSQLCKWVDFANRTNSLIIFDSAYEAFIEDNSPHSIFEIPNSRTCAIEVASFSKSFGFTNLRCGYTIIPNTLTFDGANINSMWARRQCTFFNGVPYCIQKGAEYCLSNQGQNDVNKNIDYYKQNVKILKDCLAKCNIEFLSSNNSPYIWAKCPGGYSSWQFFDYLLSNGVVCVPGVGFGSCGEGYVRFSCFASREEIIGATKILFNIKV